MYVVETEGLSMTYKYYEKEKGFAGSLKNLFYKKYLYKEAVKDINIKLERGSIVGFVGLNGAGKTTTLKMLSGILKPTSGVVKVLGFTPFEKKTEFLKQITLVMGNKSQLWWDIPAIEAFELNREIYEVNRKKYKMVLDDLVDCMKVGHLLNVQVRRLSLGERMKMELIAALIHSPSVLFLDEPTIGLDIISQHNIREFLKTYNKNYNTTIILTSHNLDDISFLCNKLVLIHNGKIIYDGLFDRFIRENSDSKAVKIQITKNLDTILKILMDFGVKICEANNNEINAEIKNSDTLSVIQELMKNCFLDIKDISIQNQELSEIIKNLYK